MRLGGQVLAVSVDPPQKSAQVVERNGLEFSILSDTDRTVIRNFGLVHAGGGPDGGDIAIPAQFLIGRDGRILWRYLSTHVQYRVNPAELASIIRERFEKP